jgi:hypothetical protein
MKRYHCLGYSVKSGECKVACFDVVLNRVEVMPSLNWHNIRDEECTEKQALKLTEAWANGDIWEW